ncbi:hypothetical protein [Microbacterium sp. H6]|uniref:hypothetical protein n=1 Tax=Microbacterium sp. H6 TaxID=421122 RepID=UPI0011BE972C|nr:hypothetical protein [Microbacterium sp. H6]
MFKSLGGRVLERAGHSVSYAFPDGGVFAIPAGVHAGNAKLIYDTVQARYGTKDTRSRTDPLRSAVKRAGAPAIAVGHLAMSKHANDRFELMAAQARLHQTEVRDALQFPEQVLWSPLHESWLWVRGRIIVAVVLDENGMTIIRTILWATEDLWEQNPRPPKEDA